MKPVGGPLRKALPRLTRPSLPLTKPPGTLWSPSRAAGLLPAQGAMARAVAWITAAYLALYSAYASEIFSNYLHIHLPISFALAVLLVFLALSSGQVFRFFRTSVAIPFLLLFCWWLLSSLLFSLKGYTLELLNYGWRFHLAPFYLCGVVLTLSAARTLIYGLIWGHLIILGLCFNYSTMREGRLVLPETSLSNPNDLAFHLLFGVAFLTCFLFDRSPLRFLVWAAGTLASIIYIFRTGSRANLLTFGVLLLVGLWLAKPRVRIALLAGIAVLTLLLALLLPRGTLIRLTSFQSVSGDALMEDPSLAGAIGSTEARKALQWRAIDFTLNNPVFGVGPRMYMYASDEAARAVGMAKGNWQVPHNTYLDISSETGIPGLVLYVWAVGWGVRTNYRAFRATRGKPDRAAAASQSLCLLLASVVYAFGTLFCSVPYTGHLPFLLGITAANHMAIQEEDRRRRLLS